MPATIERGWASPRSTVQVQQLLLGDRDRAVDTLPTRSSSFAKSSYVIGPGRRRCRAASAAAPAPPAAAGGRGRAAADLAGDQRHEELGLHLVVEPREQRRRRADGVSAGGRRRTRLGSGQRAPSAGRRRRASRERLRGRRQHRCDHPRDHPQAAPARQHVVGRAGRRILRHRPRLRLIDVAVRLADEPPHRLERSRRRERLEVRAPRASRPPRRRPGQIWRAAPVAASASSRSGGDSAANFLIMRQRCD